jgi:L-2,3-diaminopropanoate---citrate ligase
MKLVEFDAMAAAQCAARERLVNSFLRESGVHDPRADGGTRFELPLPASGRVLCGELRHWSPMGHHVYGDVFTLKGPDGSVTGVDHDELVTLLLAEVAAASATEQDRNTVSTELAAQRRRELAAQIANSVERTSRYLSRGRGPVPKGDPWALTRWAEQSLLTGHPMHPTPKSAEGFSDTELTAYSPELGAEFPLHWFAVSPSLVREDRVADDPWEPAEVCTAAGGWPVLPSHPWQAKWLLAKSAFQDLIAAGQLIPLGPLGPRGYPTSSVRTVCDPGFPTMWKLPLHVRITNFIRNNPLEHVRRAADASRLIAHLRTGWAYDDFTVLIESGYRTLDHAELAPDVSVMYRENPFTHGLAAPQVVASLLENPAVSGEPELITHVRAAGDPEEWVCRYTALAVVPCLDAWSTHGVSLEAHVQNSLVHLDDGWPTRFWVRDMEGVSARRTEATAEVLGPESPVLYDEAVAWDRLKYYLISNHLTHLIHVVGYHMDTDERRLWQVVAQELRSVLPDRWVFDLLAGPALPAKANLASRFAERGENPYYVSIPNPLRGNRP